MVSLCFPIVSYGSYARLWFPIAPMLPILAYLLLFSAAKLLIISNNFHNIMWISLKTPINFLPLQEIDTLIAQ